MLRLRNFQMFFFFFFFFFFFTLLHRASEMILKKFSTSLSPVSLHSKMKSLKWLEISSASSCVSDDF